MERKNKKRLRWSAVVCVLCAALCGSAMAAGSLIPVGEAVGIQIDIEGVLVAGLSEVETAQGTVSPAQDSGIRAGDVITAVNGTAVGSASALADAVACLPEGDAEVTVSRNGASERITVCPARETDGGLRLGLWLRDGVAGIGTITYLDPVTGSFGALGHGVNGTDSGVLLPMDSGSVCSARIVDVTKGLCGTPGELSGAFDQADILGSINGNTVCGIFGVMDAQLQGLRAPMPIAEQSQVESGPATILACVSGEAVREFQVEISRTGMASGGGRDLMVHVTDPELLSLTGGIVQGMSGSPILQNGRIVGAVTHVLVNDPTRGYGIFITTMLEASSNVLKNAA